jgi:hypothetical protein
MQKRIALLSLLLATTALAQKMDSVSLDTFEELLRGYGSVERDVDSVGDPMFTGRMEGMRYALLFYACDSDAGCNNGTFTAYFDGNDFDTSLLRLNSYNDEHRFGKASVDGDGDLEISYSFTFKGGMSREALDDTIDWWRVVLKMSREYFDPDAL